MRYGSLFTGIGGIDLGLDRAGMTCAWQVELDDYATKILEKHWPSVPRFLDVREFPPAGAQRLECDLICGGFPCTDISNAGKRAGIDGPQSGLWTEFARIVRILRPQYVLVENVLALTVRGLGRVLGDMARLGYDAEWDRIPAAAVGAPHRRWRLFIVAYSQGLQRTPIERSEPEGAGGILVADIHSRRLKMPQQIPSRKSYAYSEDALCSGRGGLSLDGHEVLSNAPCRWSGQRWRKQFAAYCEEQRNLYWPDPEPWLRRMDDGLSPTLDGVAKRVDRLRCLGNAVVPQIAEWIGRRLMEAHR